MNLKTRILDLSLKVRFFFKRKHSYFSREYYYEKFFDKYNYDIYYHRLKTQIQSKPNIISQRIISLIDKEFEYITKLDINKVYGTPNYHIKTTNTLKTELFFYRRVIGGHKVELYLHFYKNHLFFYSITFPYLKKCEKYKIINLIEKKYLNGQPFDYNNFNIIDDKHSIINIFDVINLTINYTYDFKSDPFQNIEAFISNQTLTTERTQKQYADELYHGL